MVTNLFSFYVNSFVNIYQKEYLSESLQGHLSVAKFPAT